MKFAAKEKIRYSVDGIHILELEPGVYDLEGQPDIVKEIAIKRNLIIEDEPKPKKPITKKK